MKNHTLLAAIIVVLAGCATSAKVQTVQIGDEQLSCDQIKNELVKLDQAQKEIDDKKGVTGTNVASALFWVPGLLYTYYDAGQATEAINTRRANLNGSYNKKGCK